jgi:SEC-C motif-containing protein
MYGKKRALTPEALMRSRYTAYTQGNIDYIEKTIRGTAAKQFNRHEAMIWAKGLEWVKLDVIDAPAIQAGKRRGTVKFVAHYKSKINPPTRTERGEFQVRKGRWYYTG